MILVILQTINSSIDQIKKQLEIFINQTFHDWTLIVICNMKNNLHLKRNFQLLKNAYKLFPNIQFLIKNIPVSEFNFGKFCNQYLNFFSKAQFSHFTCIFPENNYQLDFLEKLVENNDYFNYSAFEYINTHTFNTNIISKKYSSFHQLLSQYRGIEGFMWNTSTILELGKFNENIKGYELFEYFIRTFQLNFQECHFVPISLVKCIINHDTYQNHNYKDFKNITDKFQTKNTNLTCDKILLSKRKILLLNEDDMDDDNGSNLTVYEPMDNILEYIIANHSKRINNIILYNFKRFKSKQNRIHVDFEFYRQSNELTITNKTDILKHIYNHGVQNGSIYHPNQITNFL